MAAWHSCDLEEETEFPVLAFSLGRSGSFIFGPRKNLMNSIVEQTYQQAKGGSLYIDAV